MSQVIFNTCPRRIHLKCCYSILMCSILFTLMPPTVVEPASNLKVTEVSSKSMRVTWDSSLGDITGYKLTLIPMLPGMKRQELYIGAGQTSVNVRDLSPETEYEISLYALKGLTPSEPITELEKTQPVKVSTGEVVCCHVWSAFKFDVLMNESQAVM